MVFQQYLLQSLFLMLGCCAAYGGHIAGSFSYHWRQVFDNEGNLRPLETIRSELEALDTRGFDENRRFIAYCTRGIRASFGTAVFTAAGFDVEMYEGAAPTQLIVLHVMLMLLASESPFNYKPSLCVHSWRQSSCMVPPSPLRIHKNWRTVQVHGLNGHGRCPRM